MVTVPDILYVAKNGSIDDFQALEFIDDKCYLTGLCFAENDFKKVLYAGYLSVYLYTQNFFSFPLPLFAQYLLRRITYEEIQIFLVFERLSDKCGLAGTSASDDDRHCSILIALSVYLPQTFKLLFTIIEFHNILFCKLQTIILQM